MKITKNDVEKIAHLASLEVNNFKVDKFAEQINKIMQYFDKLKEVDLSGASFVSDVAFQTNVLRKDENKKSPGPDTTLANAPEKDDDFYIVPRVV